MVDSIPGDDKRTKPREGGSRTIDKNGNIVNEKPEPAKKPVHRRTHKPDLGNEGGED